MERQSFRKYAWVILFVVCFTSFGPSFAQYQISPISGEIMKSLSLNNSQFASIFSAPMIPSIFLSLVSGLMVDKFGAKKVLLFGIVITTIGICFRNMAISYETMFITMGLAGFSSTFLNANGAKILGGWFPKEKISMVMGIYMASSTVGMTMGMGTTALFSNFKNAFMVAAIINILILIIWFTFMKEPNFVKEDQNNIPVLECIQKVIKNKSIWILGLCLMFLMGCIVTISTFLPAVLISRGIESSTAGAISTMVTIGSLFGSIFVPWLKSKLRYTKGIIFTLALIAAIFTLFSWKMPVGVILNSCLFVFGAASGGLIPLLMTIPIQLPGIGQKYAGTAGGIISTIELLGAVVIPTYIIAPFAPNNETLFLMAGICASFVCLLSIFLPVGFITDAKKHITELERLET